MAVIISIAANAVGFIFKKIKNLLLPVQIENGVYSTNSKKFMVKNQIYDKR
jgi:hypothetical protein